MALIRQTRISPGPSANAIFHRGVIPILIAIILTIAIACFQLAHGSPVVLESPADNNSATHGSHNIHFVLCVNGLNAHATDFDNLQTKIRQAHVADPRDLHILVSRVNQKLQTRHGLVVMGTRLAREVHAYVRETLLTDRSNDDRMKARRLNVHLTVIGHSLGGLIARYAVRLMLADDGAVVPEYDLLALLRDGLSGSTYDTVEMVPLSYISVSSPHLGSRRPQGPDAFRRIWAKVIHVTSERGIVGRTGRELFLVDDYNADLRADASGQPPLLKQMSDPAGPYMRVLARFRQRTAVAMVQDWQVPLATAAIRSYHPLAWRETSAKKEIDIRGREPERFSVRSLTGFAPELKERMTMEIDSGSGEAVAFYDPTSEEEEARGTAHHADEQFDEGEVIVRNTPPGTGAAASRSLAQQSTGASSRWEKLRMICSGVQCFRSSSTIPPLDDSGADHDVHTTVAPAATASIVTPPSHSLSIRRDNAALVEFDEDMIRNLQQLPWRRVIFDFHLDVRHQFIVHTLAIGKRPDWPFYYPATVAIAKRAGTWIAKLVALDFAEAEGQGVAASHAGS